MATYRASSLRKFGRMEWSGSLIGFGSLTLGNMGKVTPPDVVSALVRHALDSGVRVFDTAPMYGHGLSEYRLGAELRDRDRQSYRLITKVGRTLHPAAPGSFDTAPWINTPPMRVEFDYSYDGVMRQVEDSLQRMGTDHFDVLLVHDIDRWTHGADQPEHFRAALDGAFKALLSLRDQKAVGAIGAGVNEVDVCLAIADAVDIDCLLIAGTYCLLDQQADVELLPLCETRGIAVVNGRIFGSGIMATGARGDARFDYAPAPTEVLARVQAFEKVCRRYDVPLGAVAIQFAAAHPTISTVCIGARNVSQQSEAFGWLEQHIPADLWAELKANDLLYDAAPVPVP